MKKNPNRNSSARWSVTLALLFTACLSAACFLLDSSFVLLGLYAGVSLVTFIVYAIDKKAAQRGAWRIPEAHLHLLALMGGWPGALIAQQALHHKTVKQPFRFIFWITVVLNVAILIWGHTTDGSDFFRFLLQELKEALHH